MTTTDRPADIVDLLEHLATAAEQYLTTDHRSPAREAELRRNLSDATYNAFARLRPTPEEPGPDSLVIDKTLEVWRRDGNEWTCLDSDLHPRPWAELLADWGPITRLVPATDVVDAGIYDATVRAFEAHAIRIHHELHTTAWDACDLLGMQDCAAVRDLLARARAEGATGGGQ